MTQFREDPNPGPGDMRRRDSEHQNVRDNSQSLLQRAKRLVHQRLVLPLTEKAIRPGLLQVPGAFERFEARGLHLTDARDYERPIPTLEDLTAHYLQLNEPDCPGIEFNSQHQIDLLKTMFIKYVGEFLDLEERPSSSSNYPRVNDAFAQLDGLAYWSFIRELKPARVIELGSGFSTLLAYEALSINCSGRLTVIDPFPRNFMREFAANAGPTLSLEMKPVQSIESRMFDELSENDILFIDNTHVVRTGGDVNYDVLQILPRLHPGVMVHFHDIYIPFEYPRQITMDSHRFWTEQYLLQAYLTENPHARVEFGSAYALRMWPAELEALLPESRARSGASFWFRRI